MNVSSFAAESDSYFNHDNLQQTSTSRISLDNGTFVEPNVNKITKFVPDTQKKNITVSKNSNSKMSLSSSWQITDTVFNGTGSLTDTNTQDYYYLSTASDSTALLKIRSEAPNIVTQLFIVNYDAGTATATNFLDQSGDETPSLVSDLPAGNYLLVVESSDNSARGAYTLMWNCSNQKNPNTVLYISSNLDLVTLSYGSSLIYSNGQSLLNSSNLKWEDHWTLTSGNSTWGRDQYIDYVTVQSCSLGSYTSTKYNASHALFIQLGEGTQWTMHTSSSTSSGYVNSFKDLLNKTTPRYMDANDIALGPHYLVIDLESNTIIDFASNFNYWYGSGSRTFSGTITASGI